MEVQVPIVGEKFASKKLTRKERQVMKIKQTMVKENRIYWDNIDESTAELCKAMKRYVDACPKTMALDAEDAQNRFFECVAQAQYNEIRKSKLVKPVKPVGLAKVVKQKQKALKPKPVKEPKKKPVKAVKQEVAEPEKPAIVEEAYEVLYQKFLTLTDQELAEKFALNHYTSLQEPKPEYWCTICVTRLASQQGLSRHFKKHKQTSSPAPSSTITSPESSFSGDASVSIEAIEDSPDASMLMIVIEDSDEGSSLT